MFKIGDFSKLTSVSIRMLRYYNDVGLFEPSHIDDFTGYRYYSTTQINRLNRIIRLRNMGFNVTEIGEVMSETSDERIQEILLAKKRSVEEAIANEEVRLKLISSAIDNFTKETINMKYNVELKSVPSYQVLSLREVIPTYFDEGKLWEKMTNFIQSKSIECGPVCYATYYDEGYKDKDIDVEIVMSVENKDNDEQGFTYKDTESLDQVASVLVPGDFENIAPAFQFIGTWIEEQGYQISGNPRQIPLKGPWNESDPKNFLNEIQVPVSK